MSPTPRTLAGTAFVLPMLVLGAFAVQAQTSGQGGANVAVANNSWCVQEDTRQKDFPIFVDQLTYAQAGSDVRLTEIVQLYETDPRDLTGKRAGGRAKPESFCAGPGGFQRLGRANVKIDRYGNAAATRRVPASRDCFFFDSRWDFGGNKLFPGGNYLTTTTGVQPLPPGVDPECYDPATLCLQDGRFKVEVEWATVGMTGEAVVLPQSNESGLFFFFDPNNTELLVKVLDACANPAFNSFWVFAGGLTDVEVTLTVTDTQRNQSRVYNNDLGTPFPPIQDTRAFATCP